MCCSFAVGLTFAIAASNSEGIVGLRTLALGIGLKLHEGRYLSSFKTEGIYVQRAFCLWKSFFQGLLNPLQGYCWFYNSYYANDFTVCLSFLPRDDDVLVEECHSRSTA